MNRFLSFVARVVARLVTSGLFQQFEVAGDASHNGPRLIVANHFNGFVDAVVLVRALGGLPHFIAKSTLFERLPLRLLLRLLGVIPVYRRVDHADVSANRSSFSEVELALAKGQTVVIFPEGTVTDSQQLQTIRTGAARITLSAMAAGVSDIAVVPMGITYEDKVAARSRVLVEVGEKIDADSSEVPALAGDADISDTDHALVRATTALIRDRLAAVSPEFGSLLRERVMMSAAAIQAREQNAHAFSRPALSEIRRVAQALANLPDSVSNPALDDVGRYELALSAVGLRDDQVNPPPRLRDLAAVLMRRTIIVILIAPFAFVGFLTNLIPTLIVYAVGAAIREPVSKGTARVLTALIVFPLAWVLGILWIDPDRAWLTFIVIVVGSVLLVVLVHQVIALVEAAITYSSVRSRRWLLDDLAALRTVAEEAISQALAANPAEATTPSSRESS